ncbi:Molybdopterin synthase sulfur carrier subunit [Pseudovibrio axinellae]|uniref:Molybdopterin synthase sulfur carrier subunit n=1 Tax=Pseudovibrio axinellae TaxID=989403 RepID=A0A166AVG0_9HYPH|nr:molybdopterin converting factor subunit 1 [Pseudovibrio axinellae]KZL21600.1 Molybdopterin synthase sulfur carrier subunit [Pseudovibrio axinellae]SER11180.1 molybdopterin synthase subunit MoaD [Pseudovibrio axinellae]
MKIRYFAWLRERTGTSEETIALPETVKTTGELMSWLAARDEGYAFAFEQPDTIRIAVDQEHVEADYVLSGTEEVAFFPPMTGG